DIPNGAASFTYQSWDEFGRAELISSYGDDFKRVGVGVKEFVGSIKSVGASYAYSIEDLRRSAFSGANLDSRLARAARNAIEFELDHLAAFGHKESQLTGFINNPFVPVKKASAWFGQQPKDARKIMEDLASLVGDIVDRTEEVHAPDTILMPTKHYAYLAQTPVNPNSETTILKSFLANNPYIKGIDSWKKLDENGRIVAYRRAPEICELQIPQEFEQFPPQARNMEFVINCHAKFAGVSIYYPLAVAYLDTI
ncbi:MAG: major capsid family protein, partial [Myxococcaceae bacterium]